MKETNKRDFYWMQCYRVLFIESLGNYVKIHLDNKSYHLVRIPLKTIESQLNSDHYLRIHNRTIVNISEIISTRGNALGLFLKLHNVEREIKVSRKYVSDFKKKYQEYLQNDIVLTRNDPGYAF